MRETDRYMRQHNVRVNVVTEFDNIQTIKQAIEVGRASLSCRLRRYSTILPRALAAVPLSTPKITRPLGVIYRRRKIFSSATTRFIEMLGGALVKSNALGSDVSDDVVLDEKDGAFKIEPRA